MTRSKQLTPDLWVMQSELYFTNSGIFISQGQAGLIDPCMFPQEIEAIASFVAEHSAVPQALVMTHSHWDHILGPERFPGVKTIAHANYQDEIGGKRGELIRKQIADWVVQHQIEREQAFTIPLPDQIFDKTMHLTVGDLALRLTHAPGHASDQIVIYHADSATLWAADMLSDLEIPFVSHNLAAYEQTLAMLAAWDIRVLVPGHGHPSTDVKEIRQRISSDGDYLAELRDKVSHAIGQGKTIQETLACAGLRHRLLEENTGPHQLNVESVYIEFGGEADPAQVGWSKFLSTVEEEE